LAPFLVAPNASSRRRTPYSPSFTDHPITARTSANRSTSEKVVDLLAKDQEWIRFIAESRNALPINHARAHFILEVRNFSLEPANKFSAPSWCYDLSERGGSVQGYWSDIVRDMDTHLHNMLTFFEELYILCVLDNCDQRLPFKFGVYQIPNDEVKRECPVLYVAQATRRSEQAGVTN